MSQFIHGKTSQGEHTAWWIKDSKDLMGRYYQILISILRHFPEVFYKIARKYIQNKELESYPLQYKDEKESQRNIPGTGEESLTRDVQQICR